MISSLSHHLKPKMIFPSLAIGLVSGIETTAVNLALALMIFSGDLAAGLTIGITTFFLGSFIHFIVAALGSSFSGLLSSVQDSPAVIMSVIIAAILAGIPLASPDTKFYTALASIMLTSLTTGLVCVLLAKFKLGGLVSYLPYPVIGGFLAGTGVLLVLGGLQVMTGKSVTLFHLDLLFQRESLLPWVAGVVFALILFILMLKINHYLVLPGALVAATLSFFLILAVSGTSIAEAAQMGWMVSGMPSGGSIFHLWNPAGFTQVDWRALLGQTGSMLACVIVSLVSLLLNTTGLELSTGQEINLNTELKTNGLANLIAGATGSAVGYTILSDTALGYRLGARRRLNGIIAAGIMGFVLIAGGGFLEYFPNLVLGGMLCFIGLDFLYTWLYQTWFRMPRLEFAIVLLIALTINMLGFMQGVGIGLAVAVVMFVVSYSRTSTVRHTLSGVSYQSSVTRVRQFTQLLYQHGDWLYILELQGFLFFGTANQVLETIRAHLDRPANFQPPRFILLDFRLVSGLDSSATFSFVKIKRLAQARGIALVFTHTTPEIQQQLQKDLPAEIFRYFPDLDHGIEWCENNILAMLEKDGLPEGERLPGDLLFEQLALMLPDKGQYAIFLQYLKPRHFQAGERIITEGCQQNNLFMIESGQVVAQTKLKDGSILRLRTLREGAFFGEIGLYSGIPATADVIAEHPTSLQVLTADDLAELERTAPGIAAALHRYVAIYLSERLVKYTSTIQALR